MPGRIPHDLRRSGVKHYIEAGVDPHVVIGWSGHRTESMLRRYNIIDLDDLRRAGKQASNYLGAKANVIRPDFGQRTRTIPAQSVEAQSQGGRGQVGRALSTRLAERMVERKKWSRGESNSRPLECHAEAGWTDGARRCATVREIEISRSPRRAVAHGRGRSVPYNTRARAPRHALGTTPFTAGAMHRSGEAARA
jgi:hypothetical protein